MRNFVFFLCVCLCLALISACSGTTASIFGSGTASVEATYLSEFADIPIPRDMKEVPKQTAIVHNPDGTKAGSQVFEGGVELQSLMNAMLYNMLQQDWNPRSVFRGPRSAMVFEKENNVALITAFEGAFSTQMALWVAKRINDGALEARNVAPPFLAPVLDDTPLENR